MISSASAVCTDLRLEFSDTRSSERWRTGNARWSERSRSSTVLLRKPPRWTGALSVCTLFSSRSRYEKSRSQHCSLILFVSQFQSARRVYSLSASLAARPLRVNVNCFLRCLKYPISTTQRLGPSESVWWWWWWFPLCDLREATPQTVQEESVLV